MVQTNLNNCKSGFACGYDDVESKLITCYELSKQKEEICKQIYDKNAISVFDHFSKKMDLKIRSSLLVAIMVVIFIIIQLGASCFTLYKTDEVTSKNNKDSENETLR